MILSCQADDTLGKYVFHSRGIRLVSRYFYEPLDMDKELIQSYLDNIAESIVDGDKIVTYKSLSKSLGIHVNTAKQLLYTYLTQQKAQNAFMVSATYLLAGKLADGSFNITIINESELESTYQKFIEITSEHIYSVQKGKKVREVNMLCGVDKEIQKSTCLIITSSKCSVKSKDEIKRRSESNKPDNNEAIKKAFDVEFEKFCTEEGNRKDESPTKKDIINSPKKDNSKNQKEKSQGKIKNTTGSIANMFAKATQKNVEKSKHVKNKDKEPIVSISVDKLATINPGKDKSISNISSNTGEKIEEKNRNLHGTNEENENNLSSDEEFEIKIAHRKSTSKASSKKTSASKRRRIHINSDSNDSESDGGESTQALIEVEDSEPLPASLVLEEDENFTESQPLNKRKKRKIVDKMVMHEDGYLETKKEVTFETDSDDAEEDAKKDKRDQPVTKLKTATTKTAKKQSSLLTFFKKS